MARPLLAAKEMNALETVLLAGVMAVPLYLLVQLERARLSDPCHVRNFGAAVARHTVQVDEGTDVIGFYDGAPIYASVHYLGLPYRFDCVVCASYRRCVQPRELFVEPGMLYVTD